MRLIRVAAVLLAAAMTTQAPAAQVTVNNTGGNLWVGLDDSNPTSINGDDPITTLVTVTPNVVVLNGVPSSFAVGEQNFGGSATPSAGQSFLATNGGTINNIQMSVSGAAGNYDLHLYDAGVGFPAGGPAGSTGYQMNGFPDILPADSWIKFNGLPGAGVILLDVSPFNVNLTAGNTYIFEIAPSQERDPNGVKFGPVTPGSGAMTWYRNGGNNSYLPYGQAFREKVALNGNPDRSFAMAVQFTGIPEPAAASLCLLGLLAIVGVRRRIA